MTSNKAVIGAALAIMLSSPQAGAAAAPDSSRSDSKVICREVVPIGSIVERRLICMSKAAWNKDRQDRRETEDYSGEYLQLKDPANPEMMQLGQADWAKLPALRTTGKIPYPQLVKQTRELLRRGECSMPGQSAKKFDILVNYGVKFDGNGKVSRVLVEDSRCDLVNALIGLVVLARADRGDFGATNGSGWHADQINLTLL